MKFTLHFRASIDYGDGHSRLLSDRDDDVKIEVTGDIETLAPQVVTKLKEQIQKRFLQDKHAIECDISRMKHTIDTSRTEARELDEALQALD